MATKREARNKVSAAEKSCSKAITEWKSALNALEGSVSVNSYGILHDKHELLNKLLLAQCHINQAMQLLDSIEFPTNDEYDQI